MYYTYDNIFFNILIKYQLTNSKYILLHCNLACIDELAHHSTSSDSIFK